MKRTTTILILLLAVFSMYGQEIVGTWNGAIETPNGNLRINFHISEADEGYTTTFDSPDQNAFGIPVDTTKYNKPDLTLKVNQIDFLYEGTLAGEKTINGTMKQMGQSMELNLTKKEE
jgi:hypothetical protein